VSFPIVFVISTVRFVVILVVFVLNLIVYNMFVVEKMKITIANVVLQLDLWQS